jgi:hypothetical protein
MLPRFDLEQNILQAWNVCDDLQLILDQWEDLDEDQKQNYLIGLKQMYQLKFERLWNNFELCIKTKAV